jgi:hypothetical protein
MRLAGGVALAKFFHLSTYPMATVFDRARFAPAGGSKAYPGRWPLICLNKLYMLSCLLRSISLPLALNKKAWGIIDFSPILLIYRE